jgi:ubiquitin-conjugating enzyme E2 Q
VRVVKPRFKRQSGFVMNGALCMELLTKDGWNPINDIESVIVSIRSLLVVGDGRLEAAYNLSEEKYNLLLALSDVSSKTDDKTSDDSDEKNPALKRQRKNSVGDNNPIPDASEQKRRIVRDDAGFYSVSEAQAAYSHLSDYHKKKGWDTTGWWARKG